MVLVQFPLCLLLLRVVPNTPQTPGDTHNAGDKCDSVRLGIARFTIVANSVVAVCRARMAIQDGAISCVENVT